MPVFPLLVGFYLCCPRSYGQCNRKRRSGTGHTLEGYASTVILYCLLGHSQTQTRALGFAECRKWFKNGCLYLNRYARPRIANGDQDLIV
jgi:hypothetical protein